MLHVSRSFPIFCTLIGIGGSLAAPLLRHHRTYGSRIGRSGRESQRVKPLTGRPSPRARTPVSSLTLSGSDNRLTDALPGFLTPATFHSFHPLSGEPFGPSVKTDLLCPLLTSPLRSTLISQRSASFGRTRPPRTQRRSPGVRHRTFRT